MMRWPCIHYPTTAVFVDDQKGFLNALKKRLPASLSTNIFTDPIKALDAVRANHISQWKNFQPLFSIDNQLSEIETDYSAQTYFGLHWEMLCKTIYNSQRFSMQSVVIVDQMMPGLDGISFCKALNKFPIKKIMLTANPDHSIAVQAFNEGIIDYFLLKDSPDLANNLLQKIEMMQKSYFESQAEHMLGSLLNTVLLLNDSSSMVFYKKIKDELQAIEFYLLDQWGSMLFINREGTSTTLAVRPARILEEFSLIAEDQNEHEISKSLLEKEKLVFFPSESDSMCPAIAWNPFMHTAKQWPNRNDIFYSLINDPSLQPVQVKSIQSYQSFQKVSHQ